MKVYDLKSALHRGLITDAALTKLRMQMDTVDWCNHEVAPMDWDCVGAMTPILHYSECSWPGDKATTRVPIMTFQPVFKEDLV